MTALRPVEPLDTKRRDTTAFACGFESLDRWLRAYASQSQGRDLARTYVACDDRLRVADY